jgi:Zn ribbon nucleic-acid-binding protein
VIVHCPGCNKDFHLNVSDPKAWREAHAERTAEGVPIVECFDCWWSKPHVQQTPAEAGEQK